MSKIRIMVVEDESVARMDICEMLESAGYNVVAQVSNGVQAVEKAFLSEPDLILMDVKLPKMNGLKASRVIYDHKRIPIIVVTAYSDRNFVEEAKTAGVMNYLLKPVIESDLITSIEVTLAQSKRMMELSSKIKELEYDLEIRKLVERAKGLLMNIMSITEEEAYKRMRDYSMKFRTELENVAKKIIKDGYLPTD